MSERGVHLPTTAVPSPSTLQAGQRRYVTTERLFRNEAGTGASSAISATFRMRHPSVRLHGIVWVSFLPDVGESVALPGTWTWSLDAWGRTGPEFGNRYHKGNGIVPGPFVLPVTLPSSYEAATGVDEWRGAVAVPASSGLATPGTFVVTACWEPLPGATEITDVELAKIFQGCKLQPGGAFTVFQTSAG